MDGMLESATSVNESTIDEIPEVEEEVINQLTNSIEEAKIRHDWLREPEPNQMAEIKKSRRYNKKCKW